MAKYVFMVLATYHAIKPTNERVDCPCPVRNGRPCCLVKIWLHGQ